MEYHSVPQFAMSKSLEDITDLTKGCENFYQEGTWKGVLLGDRVYGLPVDSGPNALFYNKAIFDKAGVTQVPTTCDEHY